MDEVLTAIDADWRLVDAWATGQTSPRTPRFTLRRSTLRAGCGHHDSDADG